MTVQTLTEFFTYGLWEVWKIVYALVRVLSYLLSCRKKRFSKSEFYHPIMWLATEWCYTQVVDKPGRECFMLVCVVSCGIVWLCDILTSKKMSGLRWAEYARQCVDSFFDSFERLRGVEAGVERVLKRLPRWMIPGLYLALVVAAAVFENLNLTLALLGFVLFCNVLRSVYSCKELLSLWLSDGILFALLISQVISEGYDFKRYVLSAILLCVFWILTGGAADNDAGKMAAQIVNTGTTVVLIVVNVGALWAQRHLPQFVELWDTAQYYTTAIVLPLVVAGYLTALLKDGQVYHEKKKKPGGEE